MKKKKCYVEKAPVATPMNELCGRIEQFADFPPGAAAAVVRNPGSVS